MQQFKIYSSSAGSGKTYTLTKEYLKLALASDKSDYFKQILAITFTNDAAGEMKDRILTALHGFADEDTLPVDKQTSNRQMLQAIITEINASHPKEPVTEEMIRKRAARVFSRIIHEYSDFAVSTIDSFTNKVVSAFTEELELPYNYEVSLDINDFIYNAIDRLIDRVGGTEAEKLLTDTLEEYILEKAEEGLDFKRLPSDLASFAKDNLINEKVLDFIKKLKQLGLQDFMTIRESFKNRITELEVLAQAAAQAVVDDLSNKRLNAQSFNKGSNGIAGYFEKLAVDTERMTAVPTDAFMNALEEEDWSGSKAKASQKEVIQALKKPLLEKFNMIETLKQEHVLLNLIHKNLYKISVLNEIEKELNEVKTEKNVVHISDFNKKVIQIVLNEPVPFIYERLGEKYNHILIDEFQDTSSLQWNNLLPLVANSLGKNNFNLLVGDAKQAIYGWRGGDMEQIVDLTKKRLSRLIQRQTSDEFSFLQEHYQTLNYHIHAENLNTNYRSKSEIINFNNDFFRTILDLYDSEMPVLADAYELFEQSVPGHAKTGGYVGLEFIDSSENLSEVNTLIAQKPESDNDFSIFLDEKPQENIFADSPLGFEEVNTTVAEIKPAESLKTAAAKNQLFQANMLARVLQLIQEVKEQGYDFQDIAILSRHNKDSREVATFLSEHDIPVVSSDSLLLITADAVRFMISFFQVMHRPANTLLKYECLHLFHSYILEKQADVEDEIQMERVLRSKRLSVFFSYFKKKEYEFSGFRFSQSGIYDLTERFIQLFQLMEKPRQAPYLYRFLDVALEFSLTESTHLADFLEFWEQKKEKLSISTPGDLQAVTVTSVHKSKGLEYPVVIVPFANWRFSHHRNAMMWTDLREMETESSFFKESGLPSVAVSVNKALSRTPLAHQYEQETAKLFTENLNTLYVALTRPVDRLYLLGEFSEKYTDITVSKLMQDYLITKNIWKEDIQRYVLHQGMPKSDKAAPTVSKEIFIIEEKPAMEWQRKVWQKRHPDADFIMDSENFDKEKERLNKLTQVLKKIKDKSEIKDVLQKMFMDGIVEKNEMPELFNILNKLTTLPEIAFYFSDKARFIPEKQILHHSSATSKNPDRVVISGKTVSLLLFRNAAPTEKDLKIFSHYDPLLRKMGYTEIEKIILNLATHQVIRQDE